MATALIIILIILAFSGTLIFRKYKNASFNLVFSIAAFAFMIAVAIINVKNGHSLLAILAGLLAAWMLWKIVTLASSLKRARSEKAAS